MIRQAGDSAPEARQVREGVSVEAAGVVGATERSRLALAMKIVLGGLVVAVLATLAVLRTWPPLDVVMSGSMEPTIKVGDVVVMQRLDRPARVGDVVAVKPPQSIQHNLNYPSTVVHRIVKIGPGGRVYTKGDARKQPDPFTEPRSAISSRVIATIPSAGRLLAFLTSPLGIVWLVLGAFLLLLLPYLDLRRERAELQEAELGSLVGMRAELREIAERVEESPAAVTPSPEREQPTVVVVEPRRANEDDEALHKLLVAVGEYGEHLRSHTAVMQGLAETTAQLQKATEELRRAVAVEGPQMPKESPQEADGYRLTLTSWRPSVVEQGSPDAFSLPIIQWRPPMSAPRPGTAPAHDWRAVALAVGAAAGAAYLRSRRKRKR